MMYLKVEPLNPQSEGYKFSSARVNGAEGGMGIFSRYASRFGSPSPPPPSVAPTQDSFDREDGSIINRTTRNSNFLNFIKEQQGKDPDQQAAAMIREKYQYYMDFGGPIEDEIMAELFNPAELQRNIMETKGFVSSGFDAGRNISDNYRATYGDTRTQQEKDIEERKSELRERLASAEGGDTVRGMTFDRDVNTAAAMTRIGRGMSANAQAGLTSAAQTQARIDAANEQAKAQSRSQTVGLAAAGAGIGGYLAAGTAVSGPAGAVIGGAIGLGIGLMS